MCNLQMFYPNMNIFFSAADEEEERRQAYLYGMCLLPLTRARITLPNADKERQTPEPPSRFLLRGLTQLPRSIRCKRLRPPDTNRK